MRLVLASVALAALLVAPLPASASTPPMPNCAAPEHHQFDFWIGRWAVYDTQTGKPAGSSLIEGLYRGCVLRENWTDPQVVGGSLNIYDRKDARWHQMWTDSAGSNHQFVGGMQDGKMVLVATTSLARAPGKPVLYRMTFTHNPDGSVRQYSDLSSDAGKTWKTNYDLTYRRVK